MATTFQKELEELINKYSQDKGSDTPDFIMAEFMNDCLKSFNRAVKERERWYGRGPTGVVSPELADEIFDCSPTKIE